MGAFIAALLTIFGPLLAELLKKLIDNWKKKPETAAIIDSCNTPAQLHAAMPQLQDLSPSIFKGIKGRRLKHILNRKPITDAVWDQMVTSGAKQGALTNVPHVDVLEALQSQP